MTAPDCGGRHAIAADIRDTAMMSRQALHAKRAAANTRSELHKLIVQKLIAKYGDE